MWFDQQSYQVRCEWGVAGVAALAQNVDVVIVVDVLSFSTCVDIATCRGAMIYPFPWKDERAALFASEIGGVLAAGRSRDELSLSPTSMMRASLGQRIVLPSPNGATLSGFTRDTPTLTGCFRNATAVAQRALEFGTRVGLVPAGERWPNGMLRPALEDWLGAGAILSHMEITKLSPEALTARAAFEAMRTSLSDMIRGCASGRELIERGWEQDLDLAVELDVSQGVPLLSDGGYRRLPEPHASGPDGG